MIPLSTVIFLVIFAGAVVMRVKLPDYMSNADLSKKKNATRLLDVVVGITAVLFATNIIVTPPMTLVILLDFNGLFVLTVLILVILLLLIYFNILKVPDHSEDKYNFTYNMNLLIGIIAVLVLAIVFVVFIGDFTLSDRFLIFYPLLFVLAYYLSVYLPNRNNTKAIQISEWISKYIIYGYRKSIKSIKNSAFNNTYPNTL